MDGVLLPSIHQLLNEPQTLWIGLIVCLALFTRAAIGFGDGVIAVPLLSLFIGISEAVPLILFLSTFMSFIAMWKDRAHIQLGALKRTAIMALVGFPFGVLLLGISNESIVKMVLGWVLVVLAVWHFSPTRTIRLQAEGWSYAFGLLAGILGGAYSFRGIVFAIYGSLKGWSPAQFKGTVHSFYLISGLLIPFSYYFAGLITPRVLGLLVLLLPIATLATLLGSWSSGKLAPHSFQHLIWFVLLLLGVFFIGQYWLQTSPQW